LVHEEGLEQAQVCCCRLFAGVLGHVSKGSPARIGTQSSDIEAVLRQGSCPPEQRPGPSSGRPSHWKGVPTARSMTGVVHGSHGPPGMPSLAADSAGSATWTAEGQEMRRPSVGHTRAGIELLQDWLSYRATWDFAGTLGKLQIYLFAIQRRCKGRKWWPCPETPGTNTSCRPSISSQTIKHTI
jgi:hypothetical protein